MNFLKKVIGLSMAMVMAFGGFAASAVRFINKTTGEFMEISCDADSLDEYDIRLVLNVYSFSKGSYERKYFESLSLLRDTLKVESFYDIDDTKINDYIDNNQRLKEFFEKNEYKADFYNFNTNYWWTVEGGNLNSYKKEAIIFDDFLNYLKSLNL